MAEKDRIESAQLKADYERQLEAMVPAQKDRLAQLVDHLVAQLKIVGTKYMTVNGYMQARTVLDEARFGVELDEMDVAARKLAVNMSVLADEMAKKVEVTDVSSIDESLIDGLMDERFVEDEHSVYDIAWQLLVAALLQNIGPVIDDIVNFREQTDGDIENLRTEIAALAPKPAKKKSAAKLKSV